MLTSIASIDDGGKGTAAGRVLMHCITEMVRGNAVIRAAMVTLVFLRPWWRGKVEWVNDLVKIQ